MWKKRANRKDIERFMGWLRSRDYSNETIADFILVLKRFYKFVESGNTDRETPYPESVRWLRKTIKKNADNGSTGISHASSRIPPCISSSPFHEL